MKAMMLLSTVFLSSCADGGNFCDVYSEVGLSREGATAVVTVDRPAAEQIAVNEELFRRCR